MWCPSPGSMYHVPYTAEPSIARVKASIYIYVCIWWYSTVSLTFISIFKSLMFFLNTVGKKIIFQLFFIFSWNNSLYTISKLTPYRKIFPAIYNISSPVSIHFLSNKNLSETISRGWFNFNLILQIGYTNYVHWKQSLGKKPSNMTQWITIMWYDI